MKNGNIGSSNVRPGGIAVRIRNNLIEFFETIHERGNDTFLWFKEKKKLFKTKTKLFLELAHQRNQSILGLLVLLI